MTNRIQIDDDGFFSLQQTLPQNPCDMAIAFTGALNASTFCGHPPGTVQCLGLSGERRNIGDMEYWHAIARFKIDRDGFAVTQLTKTGDPISYKPFEHKSFRVFADWHPYRERQNQG